MDHCVMEGGGGAERVLPTNKKTPPVAKRLGPR
jgi:hypothetical protein